MASGALHDIECTGWQVQCWGEVGVIRARLLYRGDQFGPEFEASSPRALAASMARYLAEVGAQAAERPQ